MAATEWRGPQEGSEHGGHGSHAGGQPSSAQGERRQGRTVYPEQGEPRAPPGEQWHPQAEFSGSAGARTPPNEKWHGVGEVSAAGGPPPPKQRPPPRVLGQTDRPVVSNMVELVLTVLSWLIVMAFFPLSMFACVRVVQEYERAIIFRLGRLHKGGAQGPGLFLVLPCMDKLTCVDLRVVSFDVAPQEILTKDLVTVSVDAVVYFRIFEPIVSVTNVENCGYSTRLLAATTLRTVLGQYSLADILSQRECIAGQMQGVLDDATDAWGVKVERVEVKDVRLPQELQRAMAAEAEASREAKAKVIAAEGEMNASLSLKRAADIMCTNPSALQLRYLQTLNTISAEKNSTIIFPVPIDILSGLIGVKASRAAKDRVRSGPGGDGAGGGDSRRENDGGNDGGNDVETTGERGGAEGSGSAGGGRVTSVGASGGFGTRLSGGLGTTGPSGGLGTRPRGGFGTETSGGFVTRTSGGIGNATSGGFDIGVGGVLGTNGSSASSNGAAVSAVPGSIGVRV